MIIKTVLTNQVFHPIWTAVLMAIIFQACSNRYPSMRINEIFINLHPQSHEWMDMLSLAPLGHVISHLIHWAHQVIFYNYKSTFCILNLGFSKGAPPSMPLMPRYPDSNGFPRASQPSNGLYNGQSGSPALGSGGPRGGMESGPRATSYSRQYSEPISSNNNFESFSSNGFDMPKSSARPIPQKLRNE